LLTRREQEILSLVGSGHTDQTISQILWVAPQAVKFHMSNVVRKLEVRNRAEAVEQAREWPDRRVGPSAAGVRVCSSSRPP